MRIGFFGGTFDPPHYGHVAALSAFISTCNLDLALVIPTGTPPHKPDGQAYDMERLNMARLAFSDIEKTKICDYEIQKGGKSYSVETLEWLASRYPDDEIVLYTGSDMLLSFHKWYKVERIVQLCSIACFSRTGSDRAALDEQARYLRKQFGAAVNVYDFSPVQISSTEIRTAIGRGFDVSDVVPQKVCEYIIQHSLYYKIKIKKNDFDLVKAEALLRARLPEKRYKHCLGVAKTAVYLAEKYGADPQKAKIAGLLHDITKNMTDDEQITFCEKRRISLTDADLDSPQVIHAITAEYLVKYKIFINDPEILSAIRYHTTGRKNMSLLEKIIYVADFIEPTRNYSDVGYYRALADNDLDEALFEGMKWIIGNMLTTEKSIHPDTIEMYNYIIKQRKDSKK